MNLLLCVMLWARPGQGDALVAYEDAVLALLADHMGVVLQRVRSDGAADHPLEVQLLGFPSRDHLGEFMSDARRVSLAAARDAAIAKTEVIEVRNVAHRD